MGFFRQEYWSGLLFPPPGDLPYLGIEPASPALAGRFFTVQPPGKPGPPVTELRINYSSSILLKSATYPPTIPLDSRYCAAVLLSLSLRPYIYPVYTSLFWGPFLPPVEGFFGSFILCNIVVLFGSVVSPVDP